MNEQTPADGGARVLRNAEAVLPDRTILADLVLRGAQIESLAPAGEAGPEVGVAGNAQVHDLGGRRVTPGLIATLVVAVWRRS